MTAKSDLPQGTLDLLIMTVAALGPVHGYAVAQRLQQVSRDVVQVPQGSLYPALHRLENRGLLPTDPLTFATMISVLVLAALFASFLPARRASRVDPMSALRQE